ncbi:MAG: AURKAIP1/COX24 domain-containing protein [Lentisphaerae bacterium]|nr:AURKAIP1/COX24 domain-containing protein [Lentisphaerota bacterium]
MGSIKKKRIKKMTKHKYRKRTKKDRHKKKNK